MSTNADSFRQDFLSKMNTFPYILFLGSGFEIDEPSNREMLDLPWNCIITSLIDDNALNDALDNEKRKTQNISAEEINSLKILNGVSLRDRHDLKIVRLFNGGEEKHPDRFAKKEAEKCFRRVVQSVGAQAVRVAIVGYGKNDRFDLNRMLDCFVDSDALKGVKTFIFDTDAKDDFFNLFEAEKDSYDWVKIYSDSFHDLLDIVSEENDELFDEVDFPEITSDDYIFYTKGKVKSLGKREWLNKYRFVHLLHEQEMKNNVPPYMFQTYFYAFLKQSPYEPQWYGYHEKNRFCLKRDIDEILYNKCLNNLENPGKLNQKPIIVVGDSGSGKSIAVANVAHRIFSDHIYPVIFQNRFDTFLNDDDSWQTNLENLLMFLEESGAPSVFLVMDQSAAGKMERDKLLHIFRKLRNHGRNLTMVFTSYSLDDDHISDDGEKKSNFVPIFMNKKLSPDEQKRLRTLLKRKARMQPSEIEYLVKLAETENDFLAFLYYTFLDLRKPLAEGIYEQFRRTIQLVIDRKDFQNDIKELLISVAIASQFKLGIPCNLAYRLIRSLDEDTISTIVRIPSFYYNFTEEGNYDFRMRTSLEADMLLRHFNMTPRTKINYIKKMLNNLRAEKNEIGFMTSVLFNIGPNARAPYAKDAKSYRNFYDIIITALKNFREETGGDLSMTLQEITYMREHAKYLRENTINGKTISDEEYAEELMKAIAVGNETVDETLRSSLATNRKVANLLIEMANSRVYLYEFDPVTYGKRFLDIAQEDLREVIATNPDRENSVYAYTTLLRSMKDEIKNTTAQDPSRLELLVKSYDFIKRVENEYSEVYENSYFYDNAQEIVGFFEDEKLSDDMFDDMIKRRKSIGIYWRACRQLKEAGIDPYKRAEIEITDEQVSICRKICDELLNNSKYKETTDLETNLECQRLLLHVVWLMYDRYPLFCEEKHFTGITLEGWQKLQKICELNYRFYEQSKKLSNDYYACHRFLYVLALCYVQLDEPEKFQKIIHIIRDKTYKWDYDDKRIVTRHIICDENRVPKSNFGGEVIEMTTDNKGYIKITGWSGLYGKSGIYFHKSNLDNNLSLEKGRYYKDFQLGLGYMGLSVFHGLKGGNH